MESKTGLLSTAAPWTSGSFRVCVPLVQSRLAHERSGSFHELILLQKDTPRRCTEEPCSQSRHVYFAFIPIFLIQPRGACSLYPPTEPARHGHSSSSWEWEVFIFCYRFFSWCFCLPTCVLLVSWECQHFVTAGRVVLYYTSVL